MLPRMTEAFDPTRRDFSPYGLTCVHWKATVMPRPDHHGEIELNFVKSGSVSYLLGGHKYVASPGRLCAFWAATPHQIVEFDTATAYMVATIPLQDFLSWGLPEPFVQSLLSGKFLSEPRAHRESADAMLFDQWAADLQSGSQGVKRPVLLEMQARLSRFALTLFSGPAPHEPMPAGSFNKVEKMACYIARHYAEKLTVQQIADHVQLNQYVAMNLFKRTTGVTFVNYIVQYRIAHAQRLLATSDMPITHIALESGFASVSRFNEAFLRSCGCAPRAYRVTIRAAS